MKKNLMQLLVLILATFLPFNTKAVAGDVPLGPLAFEKESKLEYWSPSQYADGLLCKKEETKFPLISQLRSENACTHEKWLSGEYTFLDKKNKRLSTVTELN